MSRRSAIIATDLASCVLPVPAGPSMSSGLPSRAARLTTPAILSSARYPAAARPARTDAVSANTPATSSAWVTRAPPELSATHPHYCAVTGGTLSSRSSPPPQPAWPAGRCWPGWGVGQLPQGSAESDGLQPLLGGGGVVHLVGADLDVECQQGAGGQLGVDCVQRRGDGRGQRGLVYERDDVLRGEKVLRVGE